MLIRQLILSQLFLWTRPEFWQVLPFFLVELFHDDFTITIHVHPIERLVRICSIVQVRRVPAVVAPEGLAALRKSIPALICHMCWVEVGSPLHKMFAREMAG
eukprot:SAG11_NODE_1118_length_5794_cov_8.276032_6_plen_102_part_00